MSSSHTLNPISPAANRFDFLRLVFASGVFVFHAAVLTGLWAGERVESQLAVLAELSIQGFFVISGTLVYGSWLNSKSVGDYADKRARRLYPAYAAIILIPAVVSLLISGQFAAVAKYIGANLVFLNFLEPSLPGLFEGHQHPEVNGALWTLKIEVMFYLALPVLAWILAKFGQLKWGLLGLLYIAAELWRSVIPTLDIPFAAQFGRQLPGQMSFFVIGMALWLLRDQAKAHAGTSGLLGTGLLLISFAPALEFIRPLALGGLVAGIAYMPGIKLNAARFGDISYGVYITHFPILNALIALGAFAFNPWLGFALSGVLVILASLLLWRFIERPALRADSHYRRAENA